MFKTKWQKQTDSELQDIKIKLALLLVKVESLQKASEKSPNEELKAINKEKYKDYLTPDGKFTTKKKAQEIKDSLISRN